MRLLHRKRARTPSLEEDDCYDNSYGKHVLGQVDIVPVEPTVARIEIPDVEPGNHVSTERLKRQFEERLAARRRRPQP